MQTLKLYNGETIEILDSSTINNLKVELESVSDLTALYGKLTDDNLSQMSFLTESDMVSGIYNDKHLKSATVETSIIDGVEMLIGTFTLQDIDSTTKKITALEEVVSTLMLNSLGVK